MDKKKHEAFIDEIDKLNDATDEAILSQFNRVVKKSFELSGGNLNKLPLILKRAKKLIMVKMQKEGILTVREVSKKSRAFAKVKIGKV